MDDNCNGSVDEGITGTVTAPAVFSSGNSSLQQVVYDANGEPQFTYLINYGTVSSHTNSTLYYSTAATRAATPGSDPKIGVIAFTGLDYLGPWASSFDPNGRPSACWLPYQSSSGPQDLMWGHYDSTAGSYTGVSLLTKRANNACATGSNKAGTTNYLAYFDWAGSGDTELRVLSGGNTLYATSYNTVIQFAGQGYRMAMKTDAAGHNHLMFEIVQTDVVTGGPVYTLWHAKDFVLDAMPVVRSKAAGYDFSFVVDAQGLVHVAVLSGVITYAVNDATGAWTTEAVTTDQTSDETLEVPQLALGPTGSPVIAYQIQRPGVFFDVHLTRKLPNGTWSPQVVNNLTSALRDGLEILPSGTGRILYTMGSADQAFQSFLCF